MNTKDKEILLESLKGTGYSKLVNEYFFFTPSDNADYTGGNKIDNKLAAPSKPNAKDLRNQQEAQLKELAEVCHDAFKGEWKVQGGALVPSGAVFSIKNFVRFISYAKVRLRGVFDPSVTNAARETYRRDGLKQLGVVQERLEDEEESEFYQWCDEMGENPNDMGAWGRFLKQGGDPESYHGE